MSTIPPNLAPKPPPTVIPCTLILLRGIRSELARLERTAKWPCVLVQTVTFPSGETSATVVCGSMYVWCARGMM